MKILVTGASGFIGSVLVKELCKDHQVIGVDLKDAPDLLKNYTHIRMDLSNPQEYSILNTINFDCICHLAGKIRVDESMTSPGDYYLHNIIALINLLEYARSNSIKKFILASTAAVYSGTSPEGSTCFLEEDAGNPLSVYGKTKLMGETILHDYARAYGFTGYIFRFFNVCGGFESPLIHLIPIIVNNLLENKPLKIYGTDYATRDGTCLRDYIHVKDITRAFILAINNGFSHDGFKIYNLGSGTGYTVREIVYSVVAKYQAIKKHEYVVTISEYPRRPGDFDVLLANSEKATDELGWTPNFKLDEMITDTIEAFLKK